MSNSTHSNPFNNPAFRFSARQIKLLILDVDGVLTDGSVCYTSSGEELKSFHIQDGLGLKLLQKQGINVGIITGRDSIMVSRRVKELAITHIIQGREDKCNALQELLSSLDSPIQLNEVAYMGDDLPDLTAMSAVGLSFCPADAHAEALSIAQYTTVRNGGRGAVREVCDLLLKTRNQYDSAIAPYLQQVTQ